MPPPFTIGSLTPPGLSFDEARHRYVLGTRELISVTGALQVAGLIDRFWYKPGDAERGTRTHAALHLLHRNELRDHHLDAEIDPYVRAYQIFLADSGFRVDASEERLADDLLGCAGTLDLRGQFLDAAAPNNLHHDRIDIVDVKTGTAPPWVGYQTAGYVRLLPPAMWKSARRWVLTLKANGRYSLDPLQRKTDERVFLAALTIAQAKRGWL
jgi:hypothetical protein